MHASILTEAEKCTRANSLCYMRNDCVALALFACTIFRHGGSAFLKILCNYAVRVDILRDLRLAGSTTKRSSLYAATLRNIPLSRTLRPHIRISCAHACTLRSYKRKCRK